MWIFTRYGFYSVASASSLDGRLDPNTVMVRARAKVHLLFLKQRFPESAIASAEIQSCHTTDYRYRIVVPKAAWVEVLAELANEQQWANFKDEVHGFQLAHKQSGTYANALHRIWSVMLGLQTGEHSKGVRYEL